MIRQLKPRQPVRSPLCRGGGDHAFHYSPMYRRPCRTHKCRARNAAAAFSQGPPDRFTNKPGRHRVASAGRQQARKSSQCRRPGSRHSRVDQLRESRKPRNKCGEPDLADRQAECALPALQFERSRRREKASRRQAWLCRGAPPRSRRLRCRPRTPAEEIKEKIDALRQERNAAASVDTRAPNKLTIEAVRPVFENVNSMVSEQSQIPMMSENVALAVAFRISVGDSAVEVDSAAREAEAHGRHVANAVQGRHPVRAKTQASCAVLLGRDGIKPTSAKRERQCRYATSKSKSRARMARS